MNYTINNDGTTNGSVAIKILPDFTQYIIYSDGRVYNRATDNWLNTNTSRNNNYATIGMKDDNNNRVTMSLHKLIYTTFIGEVPEGMQINHKDENRRNNLILFDKNGNITYTNLEVVTAKQNCNHGTRNERISLKCKGKRKPKQSFIVKVNNDKTEQFNSLTELITAHPSQNRLTWRYRLYDKKKLQKSYFDYENGDLLEITPISEDYKEKLEHYEQNARLNTKGEQH